MQTDIILYDRIQALDFSGQQLTTLKFSKRLTALTQLSLQYNAFQDVFDCAIQLSDCPNLRVLNLSYNNVKRIQNIPRSLTHLYVDGTDSEIGPSTTLTFLSCVQPNSVIDMAQLRQNFPALKQFLIHSSASLKNSNDDELVVTRIHDIISLQYKLDPARQEKRDAVYNYLWYKLQQVLQ